MFKYSKACLEYIIFYFNCINTCIREDKLIQTRLENE